MDPFEVDEGEGWDDDEDIEDPILSQQYSENALSQIKDYRVHSSDEIIEKQNKIILNIIEVLGIDEDDAITALKHFSWNSEKLKESWFDNETLTKKTCGLVANSSIASK